MFKVCTVHLACCSCTERAHWLRVMNDGTRSYAYINVFCFVHFFALNIWMNTTQHEMRYSNCVTGPDWNFGQFLCFLFSFFDRILHQQKSRTEFLTYVSRMLLRQFMRFFKYFDILLVEYCPWKIYLLQFLKPFDGPPWMTFYFLKLAVSHVYYQGKFILLFHSSYINTGMNFLLQVFTVDWRLCVFFKGLIKRPSLNWVQ